MTNVIIQNELQHCHYGYRILAEGTSEISPLFCHGFSVDFAAAVPGYILGGNAAFSIPWAFGTIVGLAGLVLERTPSFPTYPRVSASNATHVSEI